MTRKTAIALDWLYIALAALVSVNCTAAFVYAVGHREMTQMQILWAAAEWSIPFRWLM